MSGMADAMRVETMAVHREQLVSVHRRAEEKLQGLVTSMQSHARTSADIQKSLEVGILRV